MLTEERRQQFKDDVARQKLKTDQSRYDGVIRIAGALAMLVGSSALSSPTTSR